MALEREIQLNQFTIRYMALLLRDVSADQIYDGQSDGVNSPGWCLGHLAVEGDHAIMHAGGERISPQEWDQYFLMNASGPWQPDRLPAKDELVQAVEAIYERLREIAGELSPEFLSAECHSDFLRPVLKTEGLWYAHMLTTHVAMHCGNIAIWRQMRGLGPLFS